jgi:hypothetical protein
LPGSSKFGGLIPKLPPHTPCLKEVVVPPFKGRDERLRRVEVVHPEMHTGKGRFEVQVCLVRARSQPGSGGHVCPLPSPQLMLGSKISCSLLKLPRPLTSQSNSGSP